MNHFNPMTVDLHRRRSGMKEETSGKNAQNVQQGETTL